MNSIKHAFKSFKWLHLSLLKSSKTHRITMQSPLTQNVSINNYSSNLPAFPNTWHSKRTRLKKKNFLPSKDTHLNDKNLRQTHLPKHSDVHTSTKCTKHHKENAPLLYLNNINTGQIKPLASLAKDFKKKNQERAKTQMKSSITSN